MRSANCKYIKLKEDPLVYHSGVQFSTTVPHFPFYYMPLNMLNDVLHNPRVILSSTSVYHFTILLECRQLTENYRMHAHIR